MTDCNVQFVVGVTRRVHTFAAVLDNDETQVLRLRDA